MSEDRHERRWPLADDTLSKQLQQAEVKKFIEAWGKSGYTDARAFTDVTTKEYVVIVRKPRTIWDD